MKLKRKLESGEFAILVEMEPPKGADASGMIFDATQVREDVDAFVVPEMSNAVMRMSSLGAAMLLQTRGMETVMQAGCRDRNRLALQADLLAGYACGVSNVMAVTGEEPGFGDHHEAKSVYDIDLIELLNTIKKMKSGRDMAGIDLAGSPEFLVGSTVKPGVSGDDLDNEIKEMQRRIEAGTDFFITPPVFDTGSIEAFMKKLGSSPVKVIPTVLLLKSVGMARYIDRHMDDVHVPGELIKRIQKAPDKVKECIVIAAESIDALKAAGFSGVMISTIGWENKLPQIISRIER